MRSLDKLMKLTLKENYLNLKIEILHIKNNLKLRRFICQKEN